MAEANEGFGGWLWEQGEILDAMVLIVECEVGLMAWLLWKGVFFFRVFIPKNM